MSIYVYIYIEFSAWSMAGVPISSSSRCAASNCEKEPFPKVELGCFKREPCTWRSLNSTDPVLLAFPRLSVLAWPLPLRTKQQWYISDWVVHSGSDVNGSMEAGMVTWRVHRKNIDHSHTANVMSSQPASSLAWCKTYLSFWSSHRWNQVVSRHARFARHARHTHYEELGGATRPFRSALSVCPVRSWAVLMPQYHPSLSEWSPQHPQDARPLTCGKGHYKGVSVVVPDPIVFEGSPWFWESALPKRRPLLLLIDCQSPTSDTMFSLPCVDLWLCGPKNAQIRIRMVSFWLSFAMLNIPTKIRHQSYIVIVFCSWPYRSWGHPCYQH